MKETTLSISEAQKKISSVPDRFTGELEATIVTRYGKPVLAILPHPLYKALLEENQSFKDKIIALQAKIESLQETLEVLRDEDLMQAIRRSVQEIADNKGESLEDVLKELGWE